MHTHVTAWIDKQNNKKRIDYKIEMRIWEIHLFIPLLQCCHSHHCIRRIPAWRVTGGRAAEERQNFCLSGTVWKWVNIHTFTYAQDYSHPPKCSILLRLCEVGWRRKLVFSSKRQEIEQRSIDKLCGKRGLSNPWKNGINPVRNVNILCMRIFHHLDQTHRLDAQLCIQLWNCCQ